jgi:hypothetical protein
VAKAALEKERSPAAMSDKAKEAAKCYGGIKSNTTQQVFL